MSQERESLELDADEAEHLKQLSAPIAGEAARWISQANDAAVLSLNGLLSVEDMPRLNEPRGFVFLLLAKCVQNVRFAGTGLMLGYYSGAYVALRSALETLSYAVLLRSRPDETAKWLRNEFSVAGREADRQEQMKAAKAALFDLETHRDTIKREVAEFWTGANKRVHATLEGLAREFGIDLDFLVPDDLDEALLKAEGNLEAALGTYVWLSSLGQNMGRSKAPGAAVEDEGINLELGCRFDQEALNDLALVAFYTAHRLLDVVKDTFTISDPEFLTQYKKWHKEIRGN